ncbi:hypothetical protein [Candidatus Marithrix sp. Canyon 246]|uniref:hypothetical protein n=1 Tax=Candidatus Marithrix sp. Canyon 246 TaxID=1827136 RepID=UPI000849EE75|nr:hypothetical protein [Candidatus Marithrix sp. Canyon 246]
MRLSQIIILIFTLIASLSNPVFAEKADITLQKIKKYQPFIQRAALIFNIRPDYLSAVIYTERTLNYDWTDDAWDVTMAKLGKNSSIGFCQIKLKTAYFIEHQLDDPDSVFYLGQVHKNTMTISQTVAELIDKLMTPKLNILYAAAYLKMMQTRWKNVGFPINNRPDILGTLYSAGLYNNDGTERFPNKHPQANAFGKKVHDAVVLFQFIKKEGV